MKNLSIKFKTALYISIYILLVLFASMILTVYSFYGKILNDRIKSLEDNIISLSESFKEKIVVKNFEKIDELVNFIMKNKAVKEVLITDKDNKVIGSSNVLYIGKIYTGFTNKDYRSFYYSLKVGDDIIGNIIVFYDEEIIEKELAKDIEHIVYPLSLVIIFIFLASFIGIFLISSYNVKPLIDLKGKILSLFTQGFNNLNAVMDIKPISKDEKKCNKNIVDTCWLTSQNSADILLSIGENAIKECSKCEVFNKYTGDEISKLTYSFYIMVASLNDYISKLEEVYKERETLSCMATMGEMSAKIAHEIKNALYSISNAANYIKNNSKDGIIREFGKIIKEESNRLNEMTISFLNFSKLIEPSFKLVNLNEVVENSVKLLNYDCEDNNIKLILDLDENIPMIYLDENLIKQAIVNLVLNSIDAIKEKNIYDGYIKIKTSFLENKQKVTLTIEDNGIGIKEEYREKIFKPFFTTKPKGTGLGIPMVYKIVFLNGGSINLKSEYGKYTKFIIELPIEVKKNV